MTCFLSSGYCKKMQQSGQLRQQTFISQIKVYVDLVSEGPLPGLQMDPLFTVWSRGFSSARAHAKSSLSLSASCWEEH